MEKLLHNKQIYSYYEYQSEAEFGGMYSTSSIQTLLPKALKNYKIHKSSKTTEIYTHVNQQTKQKTPNPLD